MNEDLLLSLQFCEKFMMFLWDLCKGEKMEVINVDAWKDFTLKQLENLTCNNLFERPDIFGD